MEFVFEQLVYEAAVDAIRCGSGVEETRETIAGRWPRLGGESVERIMDEALVDCAFTPDPLAPPGSEAEPGNLHPSWCAQELVEFERDPSFAQPRRR